MLIDATPVHERSRIAVWGAAAVMLVAAGAALWVGQDWSRRHSDERISTGSSTSPALQRSAHPAPPFRFELFEAGQDESREIADLSCQPWVRDQRVLQCPYYVDDLGGSVGRQSLSFWFYNSRLAAMTFYTGVENVGRLQSSLRAKYGPPCRVVTQHWTNVFGATLPSVDASWCFASRVLTLSPIFGRPGVLRLSYYDRESQPPPSLPDVNF